MQLQVREDADKVIFRLRKKFPIVILSHICQNQTIKRDASEEQEKLNEPIAKKKVLQHNKSGFSVDLI